MRRLVELLRREPDLPAVRMAFMVAVSGLSGGALFAALARAAEGFARREPDLRPALMVLVLMVLSFYARHDVLVQTAQAAEEALLKLRLRIGDRLRRADPRWIEETGTAALLATLVQDTQPISRSALSLALLARSVLAILACLAYLGWIVPATLPTSLACAAVYAFILVRLVRPAVVGPLVDQRALERGFFLSAEALLDRSGAIRLDRRASDSLFERYARAAAASGASKRRLAIALARGHSLGQTAAYLPLVVLALAIPGLDAAAGSQAFVLLAGALFLAAELAPWPTWISAILRADFTLEGWDRLEQALAEASPVEAAARPPEPGRGMTLPG